MKEASDQGRQGSRIVQIGAIGTIVSALASPCCFPLFAPLSGLLGLSSVPFFRGNASALIQAMTALTLGGQVAAYRRHRHLGQLIVSAVGAVLVVVAYYAAYHVGLIYCALTFLS